MIKYKVQQLQSCPVAEFDITYKTKPGAVRDRKVVKQSTDIAEILKEIYNTDSFEWVESFIVIYLNKANKMLGFYKISQGGITGTVADPRIILQCALLSNATAIILSHNHPSGNLRPSKADEELTQRVKAAARYMDIQVIDHIIMSTEGYYSFSDSGLL